jgi:S-formylglutathione hydrolase FrmB
MHRRNQPKGWYRLVSSVGVLCILVGAALIITERRHAAHATTGHRIAAPPASAAPPANPSPSMSPSPAASPSAASCRPGTNSVLSVRDPSAPNGRRTVWVHRPTGPDSARIPVLYFLHGFPGDPGELTDSSLPGTLDDRMCRTGRPFVLAVPDGRAANTDTEWGDDAGGRFATETFVTDRAIGLVEGDQRRPVQLRAIGGISMGGYGAATLALRHPDEYRQIAAFGGYYRVDDPDSVFGADADSHAPDQLVSAGTGQRYFLVEGQDEDTPLMQGTIHGEADRFAARLRATKITVSVAHPPGGHSPDAWYSQLGPMVDFLDAGWRSS